MNTRAAITLRPATAADQPQIIRLARDARLNPLRLAWPNFLIAERVDGGQARIVGMGQLRPHHDGTQELASLMVKPEAQGSGVGSQLVNALIAKADRPLYLMCSSLKVAYYERFGFVEVVSASEVPRSSRLLYRVGTLMSRVLARFVKEPRRLAIMTYPAGRTTPTA